MMGLASTFPCRGAEVRRSCSGEGVCNTCLSIDAQEALWRRATDGHVVRHVAAKTQPRRIRRRVALPQGAVQRPWRDCALRAIETCGQTHLVRLTRADGLERRLDVCQVLRSASAQHKLPWRRLRRAAFPHRRRSAGFNARRTPWHCERGESRSLSLDCVKPALHSSLLVRGAEERYCVRVAGGMIHCHEAVNEKQRRIGRRAGPALRTAGRTALLPKLVPATAKISACGLWHWRACTRTPGTRPSRPRSRRGAQRRPPSPPRVARSPAAPLKA